MRNNMPTYLVRLTPIDKFFFGQKKTFGNDNANYFVHSSYFPQQTTLLGLLRYQLLQIAGNNVFKDNKIAKPRLAEQEIGSQSFTPFATERLRFGKIESISPVFIIDRATGERFIPMGKRYKEKEEEKTSYELLSLSCEEGCPPILEKYDAKVKLKSCWVSLEKGTIIPEEKFFTPDERTGIRKDYEGSTQDDSFFRQTFYKFNKFIDEGEDKNPHSDPHDFYFATLLETNSEIKFPALDKRIVYLGGERQPFVMEVSEESFDLSKAAPPSTSDKQHYTVVLLSDALIKPEQVSKATFGITTLKDFACLLTNIDTKKYYNMTKKRASKPRTSEDVIAEKKQNECEPEVALSYEQELYAAGSVFYFKCEQEAEDFREALKSNTNFYSIGYNHTITIAPLQPEK
ncbi:MAG: type III-B CRISPR module-associated protein Cmr3 [Porphyromonas sp.]|nr:type III-B CRISPR module-associated protein Cmr3 [Porphyromonas sp.]